MLTEILFLVLALLIVVSAIKMLNADELIHAVVYLGIVLGGVAGIFLTLGAELLAAVQILVYVGAVVTLILFAVMLTTPGSPTEGYGEDKTPLSMLGIEAPHGMDVESMDEVPDDVDTVADAEKATGAAAGLGHEDEADPHVEGVEEPGLLPEDEREEAAEDTAAQDTAQGAEDTEDAEGEAEEPAEPDAPDEDEAPDEAQGEAQDEVEEEPEPDVREAAPDEAEPSEEPEPAAEDEPEPEESLDEPADPESDDRREEET